MIILYIYYIIYIYYIKAWIKKMVFVQGRPKVFNVIFSNWALTVL